jgi:hypothetical protein
MDSMDARPGAVDIPDGLTKEWVLKKAKHLKEEFRKWAEADWMPTVRDNYRLFEGKPVAGMVPGAVPLPLPNSIVDTNMARLMSAMNGRENLVDAIPRGETMEDDPADAQRRAQLVGDLANQDILQVPMFMDKCDEMFKTLLLETVVIAEAYYDEDTVCERVIQRDIDPSTQQPVAVGESYNERTRRFPNLEPLSIMRCAWDPRERWNIGNSSWFSKTSMVSIDGLRDLEAKGIIQDVQAVIDEAPKAGEEQNKKTDPDAKRYQEIEGKNLPSLNFSDALYELDEFWATLSFYQNGKLVTEEFRFWVVGGEVLVKFGVNNLKPKRKPVYSAKLNRKPGMMMAQGPMDIIKPLLIDIANLMASKNKLIRSAATTPTFVEPSAGLNISKLVLEENAIVPVLNARGIVRGEPPVGALNAINEHLRFLITQVKEATAANDLVQGAGSASADTATEARILEAGASTRFQYNFETAMNSLFAPLAREFNLLRKQFMQDGEAFVPVAGAEGRAIAVSLEDLRGDYDFRAVSSQALQNRLGRFKMLKETLTELMMASSKDPRLLTTKNGEPIKLTPYEFVTEQMLPLADIKGVGSLFAPLTPQEQQQRQMQMMMQAQAQAMQSGATSPPSPQGPPPQGA